MPATITTTELATEFNTDTRTLRKFLRDTMGEGKAVVGKGSRYALPAGKREVAALRKQFDAWTEARTPQPEAEVEAPAEAEVEAQG